MQLYAPAPVDEDRLSVQRSAVLCVEPVIRQISKDRKGISGKAARRGRVISAMQGRQLFIIPRKKSTTTFKRMAICILLWRCLYAAAVFLLRTACFFG